jgi:hypothetical protein
VSGQRQNNLISVRISKHFPAPFLRGPAAVVLGLHPRGQVVRWSINLQLPVEERLHGGPPEIHPDSGELHIQPGALSREVGRKGRSERDYRYGTGEVAIEAGQDKRWSRTSFFSLAGTLAS